MEIQVGKDPDFIMTRGKDCVFHRSKITITSNSSQTLNLSLSNRSLYTLCRDIMSICQGQKIEKYLNDSQSKIVEHPRRSELRIQSSTTDLLVWLSLENSVNAKDEARIVTFFRDFFTK